MTFALLSSLLLIILKEISSPSSSSSSSALDGFCGLLLSSFPSLSSLSTSSSFSSNLFNSLLKSLNGFSYPIQKQFSLSASGVIILFETFFKVFSSVLEPSFIISSLFLDFFFIDALRYLEQEQHKKVLLKIYKIIYIFIVKKVK